MGASGQCGSVSWASPHARRGCWFPPWSGHVTGLRARSPVESTQETAEGCYVLTLMVSLFFLPLLKKINKLFSLKKVTRAFLNNGEEGFFRGGPGPCSGQRCHPAPGDTVHVVDWSRAAVGVIWWSLQWAGEADMGREPGGAAVSRRAGLPCRENSQAAGDMDEGVGLTTQRRSRVSSWRL